MEYNQNNQTQSPMTNVPIANQYGQPVGTPPPVMNPPTTVVVNQNAPHMLRPDEYKTTPVCVTCPSCRRTMTTVVRKKFNCCTCLLCYCTGIICYVIVQCCRGKDFCCYDADHTCPHCNALVGVYTSC